MFSLLFSLMKTWWVVERSFFFFFLLSSALFPGCRQQFTVKNKYTVCLLPSMKPQTDKVHEHSGAFSSQRAGYFPHELKESKAVSRITSYSASVYTFSAKMYTVYIVPLRNFIVEQKMYSPWHGPLCTNSPRKQVQ